jgi:protease PrsW
MINVLIVLLIALGPCIFWLWLIYKWDKYQPEPKFLIIRTFLIGMAIAVPVGIVEIILYPGSLSGDLSLISSAYAAFVVAGLTEETGKFLVVRLWIYKSSHFDEPSDGLIYSAAAALGFASVENIIYLISYGWQVILVRALFSNIAHVLFSALWGYPLALTKLGVLRHKSFVWLGLLAAIAAHGIFDFLLFTQTIYSLLVIPIFIAMVVMFILMMRHANRISIFNIQRP